MVATLIGAAEALDVMFGLYVRVVAATGMRRGEACGLRWSDVDLDVGKLTVQRSHIAIRGSVGDQPTKTRSVRTVTLDAGTTAALTAAWRAARRLARFAGVDDDTRRTGYVFSFDADGAQAWRGDMVSARWIRTRRAAGVEAFAFTICGTGRRRSSSTLAFPFLRWRRGWGTRTARRR